MLSLHQEKEMSKLAEGKHVGVTGHKHHLVGE